MTHQATPAALPAADTAREQLTLAQLTDEYFAQYAGRDDSRPHRLAWWTARLGDRAAATITDDDVFAALEDLAGSAPRRYAGRDADGRRVFRARAATPGAMLMAGASSEPAARSARPRP